MIPLCDFKMEEARAKNATTEQLQYMIQDALEAFKCNGLGKYADQISVYRIELRKRNIN